MNEYVTQVINDQGFYLSVVTFGGLYFSCFLIGYFISLVIGLLHKISR